MTFDEKTWKREYRKKNRAKIRLYKIMNRPRDRAAERVRYKAKSVNFEYRRRHYLRVRAQLWQLKDGPCADCGVRYPPCVMDFDHRDPTTKVFSIGTITGRTVSREVLATEVAKCDLVCANCHRLRTWRRSASSQFVAVSGEVE